MSSNFSSYNFHKTGVINDPLGQTPIHCEYCFHLICFALLQILESRDVRTYGRIDVMYENKNYYQTGQPSGSIYVKPWMRFPFRIQHKIHGFLSSSILSSFELKLQLQNIACHSMEVKFRRQSAQPKKSCFIHIYSFKLP